MEAHHVIQELGEPVISFISHHEVIEVDHKKVSWYTLETTWSKERVKTTKKQRFKYIQEALLRVRDTKERLKIAVQLPMLPLSIIRGTSEVIRGQRTSEFNAFLAAAISVPKLRVLPSLVLLLAPVDTGSHPTMSRGQGPGILSGAPTTISTADALSSSTLHASESHPHHADTSTSSWLPAEPSTQSMAVEARGGSGAHDEAMHAAHDDASGSEEGAAASHAVPHLASQHVHGFQLQPPTQRYPYHGTETSMIASSSKVAKLESMIAHCLAVSKRLGEDLETKDATIRHLQEELDRTQEALRRAEGLQQ